MDEKNKNITFEEYVNKILNEVLEHEYVRELRYDKTLHFSDYKDKLHIYFYRYCYSQAYFCIANQELNFGSDQEVLDKNKVYIEGYVDNIVLGSQQTNDRLKNKRFMLQNVAINLTEDSNDREYETKPMFKIEYNDDNLNNRYNKISYYDFKNNCVMTREYKKDNTELNIKKILKKVSNNAPQDLKEKYTEAIKLLNDICVEIEGVKYETTRKKKGCRGDNRKMTTQELEEMLSNYKDQLTEKQEKCNEYGHRIALLENIISAREKLKNLDKRIAEQRSYQRALEKELELYE